MAETFVNYYEGWLEEVENRKDLDNSLQGSDITCQEALVRTFMTVPEGHRETKAVLRAILMQKGLEHLGSDCPDGRLTTYMDTVIFG